MPLISKLAIRRRPKINAPAGADIGNFRQAQFYERAVELEIALQVEIGQPQSVPVILLVLSSGYRVSGSSALEIAWRQRDIQSVFDAGDRVYSHRRRGGWSQRGAGPQTELGHVQAALDDALLFFDPAIGE